MSAATVSSTTLWATASKEWVIPAKPKPGRKPKKDTVQPCQEPEVDKGRRVQNRAAQRAFRERKQSQLAELQARVQQYEQGEVERNVALQNIAKRLKEENEKLRAENILLKEKVGQLEECLASHDTSKKRIRGDSVLRSPSLSSTQSSRKKYKLTVDMPNHELIPRSSTGYDAASSPSSSGSSPSPQSKQSSHTSFSPLPVTPSGDVSSPSGNTMQGVFDLSSDVKSTMFEGGPLSCGFCSESTSCVCKDITMQQVSEQLSLSDPSPPNSLQQPKPSVSQMELPPQTTTSANLQPSILNNLPDYQAPVPLRRRSPIGSARPVFSVAPLPQPSTSTASCSGDPSNCLACADDTFGKAFCEAIGRSSTSASSQCSYCPEQPQAVASTSLGGCCGNPIACGGCVPSTDAASPPSHADSPSPMLMSDLPAVPETISCDNAWRQLKQHPNVEFADLTLLADVVARRSKCTGPRLEIYAAPGSPKDGADLNALNHANSPNSQGSYEMRHVLQNSPSPPPQLVPQEVLISCGRQRVREVMADGVREALRMLDAKFPLPGRMNNFRN